MARALLLFAYGQVQFSSRSMEPTVGRLTPNILAILH